jgi:hypothetical protein
MYISLSTRNANLDSDLCRPRIPRTSHRHPLPDCPSNEPGSPHPSELSLIVKANTAAREQTEKAIKWFDNEKELWVVIVTGARNSRAFSAGADLKEWLQLYHPCYLRSQGDLEIEDRC